MREQKGKWYGRLKSLLGKDQMDELLSKREGSTGSSVSRRQFLAASTLTAGFLGSLLSSQSTGILSSGDLQRALSSFDQRALNVAASTIRERTDYLRWLGVKWVERPTYERYIVEDPLPAIDARQHSFASLTPEEQALMDELWPPRSANPAEMDADTRIIYEFGSSLRALNSQIYRLQQSYSPPSTAQLSVTDPAAMSFIIKKFGTMLGAGYVGITPTKPNIHISTHTTEYYENTIIVAEPQPIEWAQSASSPGNSSHFSSPTSFFGYSRMAFMTQALTMFIRGLGYNAYGHGTSGIFLVPMAIDAGVGEAGRTARVVAPDYGAAFRLAALTTDLPLEPDQPISFNMHEFCSRCEICADVCPANARPRGPPGPSTFSLNRPGMSYWYDRVGCRNYWGHGGNEWSSCFRCHAFCPWSTPRTWYHDLAKWSAINLGGSAIDILVDMSKSDLANMERNPSEVLWDQGVPSHPVGRKAL